MDSGYRRAGQTWRSVQILLVQASVLDAVQTRLARLVHGLKYGDPGKAETIVGPLISESEAIRVEISIEEAVAKGAVRLAGGPRRGAVVPRSEEHTSELQSLMRTSYAVFCLKKNNKNKEQ